MKRFATIFVPTLAFVIAAFAFFYFNKDSAVGLPSTGSIDGVEIKQLLLNQEDVSNITKPAVVSIYHHIEGTAIIPFFDIDWATLEIIFPLTKEPIEYPVSEDLRGSGFIVSEDGYVVTNAHVASDLSYKRIVAQQLISLRFQVATKSADELKQIDAILKKKGIKETDAAQFGEELALSLGEKLAEKISLTATQKIVVLNSSSTESKLSDLISKGFPATIVDVNENYIKDEKDIAILKIGGTNYAAIDLASSQPVNIGNKIYVSGFPSSGQFNTSDVLEPTLTEGTVSGLKDSKTRAFQVIQTDAKVSPGSSGGPLLNEKGEVAGILTFASGADEVGDAFAFAIPVKFARDMFESRNITIKNSGWALSLKSGITHLQNNQCKSAIEDFEKALTLNSNVAAGKNINVYIDRCKELIYSGKSIDNLFDELKSGLSNLGSLYWILACIGFIIFVIIIFIMIKLIRRIRKDEQEIRQLEHLNTAANNSINIGALNK